MTRPPRRTLTRRQLLAGATAAALLSRRAATQAPRTAARFDPERFVAECRQAAAGPDAPGAILQILSRSVADPGAVLRGVGAPKSGGINTLYRSAQLTILNIVWSPLMQLMPHEHRMWSVIGIYTGREDNIFWRRSGRRVSAERARALAAGEAAALGADVIHSVANPIARLTGAIHVYGGDFFATARSEWDPETLAEHPWDIKQAVRIFRESNERFAAWQAGRSCA